MQSNAQGNPPTPSLPCCPLVSCAPGTSRAPRSPQAVSSVAGHPRRSCPWYAHTSRALGPCLACFCSLASPSLPPPSGQREHGAEQFARQPTLPAPPLCSRSLAQPYPLCARSPSSSLAPLPRPLCPWPSVSLSPSSLYLPGVHSAEQYAWHPSLSPFTFLPLVPWSLGKWHARRTAPACGLFPKCPTSCALFVPSSLVLAGPRCMTLRRTLHLWGRTALWQHAAAPRLVQCPRALRAARSLVGHLFAPAPRSLFHAAVARSLPCPATSVPLPSGQREHDAEQFARQRSLSAPPLCPGPLALSFPRSARPPSSSLAPLPRPLGPWPSVSLSPSSLYPPGIHFAEQSRGIPRTPSSPCRPLVPWSLGLWHARRTAPACGLCPSSPALPPPPSPALFPLGHYAGHCVGKSQARRRHVAGTHLASIGGVVGLVDTTLWPPAAATAPAGTAAAGSHSKCRGGRGPGRPRLPPGQGFTVPPAAPSRRGGSITKICKNRKKIDYIYIYIYIYIYPLIYTPLPYSTWLHSKVRAKGTTWCIHVAEGAKLDQNRLKMGSIHLFVHPQWSKITFRKMCF